MQERLHQFGGEMSIEVTGSGTRVSASIPLPKDARSTETAPVQAAV
jgi:signal transduction histidine kinase